MNIFYTDGAVTNVTVDNEKLQTRMTQQERVSIFGRNTPDAATMIALDDLENRRVGSSVSAVCTAMVNAGDITSQRASEISA